MTRARLPTESLTAEVNAAALRILPVRFCRGCRAEQPAERCRQIKRNGRTQFECDRCRKARMEATR